MDGNFMKGIEFPILAGFGAVIGIIVMIPIAIASIWFPWLALWLWVPPVFGTIAGLVSAIWTE